MILLLCQDENGGLRTQKRPQTTSSGEKDRDIGVVFIIEGRLSYPGRQYGLPWPQPAMTLQEFEDSARFDKPFFCNVRSTGRSGLAGSRTVVFTLLNCSGKTVALDPKKRGFSLVLKDRKEKKSVTVPASAAQVWNKKTSLEPGETLRGGYVFTAESLKELGLTDGQNCRALFSIETSAGSYSDECDLVPKLKR